MHTTQLSIDTHIHTHAYAHTYTRTHTLTRLLEKGVRIWEGMVLCIRSSLAIGIHRGTLAYIRLECARGGEAGGVRQSVCCMCMCVVCACIDVCGCVCVCVGVCMWVWNLMIPDLKGVLRVMAG